MSVDNELQRLQQLYAGLSDGQLLNLAESKEELTEAAQQAVDVEMGSRGLTMPTAEDAVFPAGAQDGGADLSTPDGDLLSAAEGDPSLVDLMTFNLATDAEKALHQLDEHGIPVTMEPAMRRLIEGGPRIKTNWLTIFVEKTRLEEARGVLRKTMGLFPVMTVDQFDPLAEGEDDDVLLPVGSFEVNADTEIAREALTEAGIWFTASSGEEDEDQDGDVTTLRVRAEDLDRGMAAIEAAFEKADQGSF